jgi:hypothetical protein
MLTILMAAGMCITQMFAAAAAAAVPCQVMEDSKITISMILSSRYVGGIKWVLPTTAGAGGRICSRQALVHDCYCYMVQARAMSTP